MMKTQVVESIIPYLPDRETNLSMIVVYSGVSDLPHNFVARLHIQTASKKIIPTEYAFVGDTYSEILKKIPTGFVNIGRMPDDDPVIVEVWI